MAKRKLTKQQRQRIRESQLARSKRARNQPGNTEGFSDRSLGQEQSGLVIANYGRSLILESASGTLVQCTIRQNMEPIACGDNVAWRQSSDGTGVVVAIHPRRSLLCRPGIHGGLKQAAANIDKILIVAATKPQTDPILIDRYLVAAEHFSIAAVIVINKTDLVSELELQHIQEQYACYRNIGYPVILCNTKKPDGLATLEPELKNHIGILVGQSGVGKSSITKRLLPDREIQIGKLGATELGRHTTTTAMYYHLPCGGGLIDSPGVRDFGVWNMEIDSITHGFIEFKSYVGQCQFRNCTHSTEPGCAIRQAVKKGEINRRRYDHYLQIIASLQTNTK